MKKMFFITGMMIPLMALPLVGIALKGEPLATYTEFPPLTRYVAHADFSWIMFVILSVFILAWVCPFLMRIIRYRRSVITAPSSVKVFPWWGWAGLALTAASWVLAWSRFEWFDSCQVFTFTPIWIGYIVTVNALTFKRTGKCMMLERTGHFISLFIFSAAFWWYFEYLNRFVQNWYYEGITDISRLQYFIFATLPFSTVLPAVMGTYDLLESHPVLSAGLEHWTEFRAGKPKLYAAAALVFSSLCLALIGLWPDYLFPMLWLAPLFIITSIQVLLGRQTVLSGASRGDWRRIWLLAVAALICGFFWELWNYHSVARWVYAVPFVGRFRIFEMPVLGFAGYLPFGLECAAIADLITRRKS